MSIPKVPGLRYIPCYVSVSEEADLLEIVDALPWLPDLKRRVQHYGYRYDYKRRKADPSLYLGPLPEWAQAIAHRLCRDQFFSEPPDQLIVNEYLPAQGITAHVDCIPCFGDSILSLSLGGPCVMTFAEIGTQQQIPVLLEPRSLVVMQGAARAAWKHAIAPRKTDVIGGRTIRRGRRVSLTFRKVRAVMDR